MTPRESRQFRTLYHLSLTRLLDLEIIASRGDLYGLFARTAGILIALSFLMLVMFVLPYRTHIVPGFSPRVRNDEEFLISITLALTGLLSVLAWNNLLPDRRDCLVLGNLPLRVRTMALSRLAAILTCIAAVIAMTNFFVGLAFPYVIARASSTVLLTVPAWWITLLAAGVFALSWTLALQGISALILRWHTFQRVSAVLQMLSLAIVLAVFFLTPPFSLTLRQNPELARYLPSYWFTALLGTLAGDPDPAIQNLAAIAIRNLSIIISLAAATFALAWMRGMRVIVEAPEIVARSGQSLASHAGDRIVRLLIRRPFDRALIRFIARTIFRSRQHRLLLAAYAGIGFALAIAFARSMFGSSRRIAWTQPNAPLLIVGMLLAISAVLAVRAVFVLPHSLSANWIFRITLIHPEALYYNAVRKSLIFLAAIPVWIACTALYLAVWPPQTAIPAALVLVLFTLILSEYAIYQFEKLPFTCSWLPASGQSMSTVRAMAYGIGFLTFATAFGNFELWVLGSTKRIAILCWVLTIWAVWLFRRGQSFADSDAYSLRFDDTPEPEILTLDLHSLELLTPTLAAGH